MSTYSQLELKNQLCFPLYAAARKITSAYTPYLKPLGLTYTQYIVMLVLWENDGISVGEICEELRLDSGTITPLLKKLETEGIVERRRCCDDERVVSVFLTEEGKVLREKVKDVPFSVGSCVHLSEQEVGTLYTLLYKLLEE